MRGVSADDAVRLKLVAAVDGLLPGALDGACLVGAHLVTIRNELANGHAVYDHLVIDDQRGDLAGRVVVARFLAACGRSNDLVVLAGFLQRLDCLGPIPLLP